MKQGDLTGGRELGGGGGGGHGRGHRGHSLEQRRPFLSHTVPGETATPKTTMIMAAMIHPSLVSLCKHPFFVRKMHGEERKGEREKAKGSK